MGRSSASCSSWSSRAGAARPTEPAPRAGSRSGSGFPYRLSAGRGMRRRIDAAFARFVGWLAASVAVSIGLFAILIPLNLFLVFVGWGSLAWLYEAVEYALYVGVFIGAPWVLRQGAHIRVDVVIAALPGSAAARLEKILDAAGFLLCLLLSVYGLRATLLEFEDGTLPDKDLRIENGYMMAVFALSFLLLAVEFMLRFRRAADGAAEDEGAPAGSGF